MDKIGILKQVKSLNELLRMHWAIRKEHKEEYRGLIRNMMKLNKVKKTKPGIKWNVTIVSFRKRMLDKDNLIGGAKILLDSLALEGFIWDDTPDMVNVRYYQQKAKHKEQCTLITRELPSK